jgi:hypothetical protein
LSGSGSSTLAANACGGASWTIPLAQESESVNGSSWSNGATLLKWVLLLDNQLQKEMLQPQVFVLVVIQLLLHHMTKHVQKNSKQLVQEYQQSLHSLVLNIDFIFIKVIH